MTRRVPAPLLVLTAIVSVQFGGALAATLIPLVGAAGSVALRLVLAAAVLLAVARPRLRGRTRADWLTVCAFALVLGLMNLAFYSSLARLPLGVAVTIEFVGPLVLATVLSRRLRDLVAVAGAALGVVLISGALTVPWDELEVTGILLALTAGACWAAYILLSARTGTRVRAAGRAGHRDGHRRTGGGAAGAGHRRQRPAQLGRPLAGRRHRAAVVGAAVLAGADRPAPAERPGVRRAAEPRARRRRARRPGRAGPAPARTWPQLVGLVCVMAASALVMGTRERSPVTSDVSPG